jgi:hypothetical protein
MTSSCVSGTEILVTVKLNNFLRTEGILFSEEGLCFMEVFGWYRLH